MIKKYSNEGDLALDVFNNLNNITFWLYEQVKPFLKGNILEIGSGKGTYSKKIIKDFPESNIFLSDVDDYYVKILKKQFHQPNFFVSKIDFENKKDFKNIHHTIDSALALNVLEHVDDDVQALKNVYNKLSAGGVFIVLVPMHKFLFNSIDRSLGHYRRYTKKEFLRKVSQTDFKIKKIFCFNFLAIFGWYISGNILKRKIPSTTSVYFFNKLVPFIRIIENFLLRNKIGISLIIVLEK